MSNSTSTAEDLTTANLKKHNQAWDVALQNSAPNAPVGSTAATWGSASGEAKETGLSGTGTQRNFAMDNFLNAARNDDPWHL